MPTLGFLKKIRTRESPGQKNDLASPTATSSQPTSPITPTTSRTLDSSIATVSTLPTPPQTANTTQSGVPPDPSLTSPTVVGAKQSMPQGHDQQQQHAHLVPASQQNVASINQLVNPPQNDGASHSRNEAIDTLTGENSTWSGNKEENTQAGAATQVQTLPATQVRQTKGKYSLGDFEILRTLGTGSFGRVHLVQSKHNQRFYAVKVLKKVQVVKMKQVEHTNDERKMLQEVKHPFLITLWGTFQDARNVYLVMDFVEGGELFSLLRKSQVLPAQESSVFGFD